MLRRISFAVVEAARKRDQLSRDSLKIIQRSLRSSSYNGSRRYDRSAFGEGTHTQRNIVTVNQRSLRSILAACLGLGTVVYVSNLEGVPVTKRSHLILFPRSWESSIGKSAVQATIPKDARVLPDDHPRTKSVQFIVNSLAQHIDSLEGLPAHMKNVEWHVTVVDSNKVNAMAAPGGHVLVFTGIMDLLSNRNELAGVPPNIHIHPHIPVLAHEMAHVLARHSAETVTRQMLFLPVSIGLALMLDTSTTLFGQLHKLMVDLPGSRANEREADLIGMHLAARACYAPSGMVNMLKKLALQEKRSGAMAPPPLLRTHPLTAERVEECRRRLPEVRQVLEISGCDPFLSQFSVPTLSTDAFSPFQPPQF